MTQTRSLELCAGCPEIDLDYQIRELSSAQQMIELGLDVQDYLCNKLEKLKNKYGEEIGNEVMSGVKGDISGQ